MEDKIKITKDLKFDYEDLMKEVDQSQEFTLRDILTICVNSKIPMQILRRILQCNYIADYYIEAFSKPSDNDSNIDHLELYWWGGKDSFGEEGTVNSSNAWAFHGIGKVGYVPEDLLEHGNLTEEEKKTFRQAIAVEFSPMYNLADYQIKIGDKLHITDYDVEPVEDMDSDVDFKPSITLVELLYAIFWELSFCGSIEGRDDMSKMLQDTMEDFERAKEDGTLKLIPHEEVMERMKKKIKEIEINNQTAK